MEDSQSEIYEQNLEILEKRFPSAFRKVSSPSEKLYELERKPSRSGTDTLKVTKKAGRNEENEFYLHSKYDPLKEAFEQSETFEIDSSQPQTWFVLGMGLGYHLELLLRKTKTQDLVFVFVRDEKILKKSLQSRDMTSILRDQKLRLAVNIQPDQLYSNLRPFTRSIFKSKVQIIPHPPSLNVFNAYYKDLRKKLQEFIKSGESQMRTGIVLPRRVLVNRIHNLSDYVHSPGILPFQNRFEEVPGFLISAGPSLEDQMSLLPEVKKRGITFCVGTALSRLLNNGFTPDFTGIVDYHTISQRYYKELPNENVTLIADPRGAWEAIEKYQGPKAFYKDRLMPFLLGSIHTELGNLEVGGTVADLGFQFLTFCGCNPIVFLGQDLAFSYNISHVPGTPIHDEWLGTLNRFRTLEMKELDHIQRKKPKLRTVKNIDDREVITDENLFHFLKELGHASRQFEGTVIDATEGGAKIDSTQVLSLETVLDRYDAIDISSRPIHAWYKQKQKEQPARQQDLNEELRGLKQQSQELEGLYDDTLELLEDVKSRIHDGKRTKDLVLKIHDLRDQMDEYNRIYHILRSTESGATFLRDKEDEQIESRQLEGYEKQLAQVHRNVKFLTNLKNAVQRFQNLLEKQLQD